MVFWNIRGTLKILAAGSGQWVKDQFIFVFNDNYAEDYSTEEDCTLSGKLLFGWIVCFLSEA